MALQKEMEAWKSDLQSDHIKHMILFRMPPLMVHDKNIPTQLIGPFIYMQM